MTATRALVPATEFFRDLMSEHATSVAVVTARQVSGAPGGLLVSSLCSYSTRPPSLLIAIDAASRSYPMMVHCERFGVHLLGRAHATLARTFAGRAPDRFADQDWTWDDDVPRLAAARAYLRCATTAVLPHGDHAVIIGKVTDLAAVQGEPLIHYRRSLGWSLRQEAAG